MKKICLDYIFQMLAQHYHGRHQRMTNKGKILHLYSKLKNKHVNFKNETSFEQIFFLVHSVPHCS